MPSASGGFLADLRRAGPADQHSRSAQDGQAQRRDWRAWLLDGVIPVADQPGAHAGDAGRCRARPTRDQQLRATTLRSHRHSQDEQRRPIDGGRRRATASPSRSRTGGRISAARALRPGPRTGNGSSRTTRTRTGASPATTRRSCARTWSGIPISGAGNRRKSSTR